MPTLKLRDCVDLTKYAEKIKAIEESNLPEQTKDVLKIFAYRFIRIDFESVANYYAYNASDEEKEIIERLRLVLVDGGINGFINDDLLKVAEEIVEMNEDDEE